MKKLITFLTLFLVTFSWGKTYVFLVGINKYKFQNELYGAVNDIKVIETLFQNKGVKIFKLTNKKATKSNILNTLENIKNKLKKGDRFYFFYSGHGTGYKDLSFSYGYPLELEYSGAIIPYNGDTSTPQKALNTLIWGYKDLKPILSKIDEKGALSFIFFDSCFSGFTVRSLPVEGNSRTIPLPNNIEAFLEQETKIPSYSYKNIIYGAASTNFELAKEMPRIKRGYFSFYLEKAFKGDADFNKDGQITKKELENYFLRNIDKIPSSPIIYPEKSAKDVVVYDLSFRQNKTKENSSVPNIYLKNVRPSEFSDFKITKKIENADFIVKRDGDNYSLIYRFGMAITKTQNVSKIKDYIKGFKLFLLKGNSSDILKVEILKGKVPVKQLRVSDTGVFRIENGKSSHLFILSMDKEGNMYLLEPVEFVSLKKVNGIEFEVFADKPVGVEFIKVFSVYDKGLSKMIFDELKKISKQDKRSESFIVDKNRLKNLIKILQSNKNKWTDVLYPFISYE